MTTRHVINTSTAQKSIKSKSQTKKKKHFSRFKDNYELSLLAFPAVLYYIIFHYLPMIGVIIAFKDYRYDKGIIGSKWVGLKNFEFFFTSQDAIRITCNTIAYSTVFIITGIVFCVIVALILFEITNKLAIKFYQTVMILPNFMSWVIVGYITYILLNPSLGVLNQLLEFIGHDTIQWYSKSQYWPTIIVAVNTWKNIGMGVIIYYAALMSVDSSLFEAAEIDGANRLKQIWHISIPSLIPLMTILSILAIGNMFRGDFGLFYQITRDVGVLYPTTDIIDTYVYRGLRTGNIGMSSAVGFFQSFVGLILVMTTNYIVKKIDSNNSLY